MFVALLVIINPIEILEDIFIIRNYLKNPMEDISITEKRSNQRISLKENIRFGVNSPEYDGISQDLSPKGMSISSQKALPVNSSIIIRFNGSIGDITAEGKVIWVSSPPGINSIMGIRFTGTNDKLINLYNKRARYKS